jgi:hydrogenase nickel incorporation protein HypB
MCGVCGCEEAVHATDPHPAHDHGDGAGTGVPLLHAHGHAPGADARRVSVEQSLLAHNRDAAARLRAALAARGIEAIALVGGPGAGKTSLLEATFAALGRDASAREAVVEGDCATDLDARRVAACGARAVQVATGALCHLDAHLVAHAIERIDLRGVARLWIENVGNLVCTAGFPCGEHRRVALLSVPEGDDKPEKYPALFASADLLVVTKADLLPHVAFDVERCVAAARRVRPGLAHLVLSARSGAGMDAWLAWLAQGGR